MTHTTVSTTHYYPQYSRRSIISLHGSLLNTVTFFRLAYIWLLLFSLLLFFLAKTVTFYPLLFFLLLSFRALLHTAQVAVGISTYDSFIKRPVRVDLQMSLSQFFTNEALTFCIRYHQLLLLLFIFRIVTDIHEINTYFVGVQFVVIPYELYSCDL